MKILDKVTDKTTDKILPIQQIQSGLQLLNIREVARGTGINRASIARIRNNGNAVAYSTRTVQKLSQYLIEHSKILNDICRA